MVAPRPPRQMFMPPVVTAAGPTTPANMFAGPLQRPRRDFDWASLLQGIGAGLLTGRNVGEGLGQGLIYAREFGDQRADNEYRQRREDREEAEYQYQIGKDQQAAQKEAQTLAQFNATIDAMQIPDNQKAFLKAMGPGSASYGDLFPGAEKGTDDQREYDLAKQQGFQGSFLDYLTTVKRAGAPSNNTTIYNKDYGTIPPGFRLVETPEGVMMEAVPGSPADVEAQAAADKAKAAAAQKSFTAGIVTDATKRARDIVSNSTLPTTGLVGNFLKDVAGTEANDLRAMVDTIKANASFDALQQMRQNSPTGGALGAVSDMEMRLLGSTIASLEQSQTKEQFLQNLQIVEETYDRIINGPRNRTKDDDSRPSTVIDGYTIRPK